MASWIRLAQHAQQTAASSSPRSWADKDTLGLTWRPSPAEGTLDVMQTALSKGANFWNGGEFYGSPEHNSLHLLNEYFTKHPDHADKVVLSIKGGLKDMKPDGTPTNVRRSIDECLRVLDGKKFLDLFECARVDPSLPIETTVEAMAEYVKAGKIGGISLSECSAESIRRAAEVHKIAAVEVEFSLWATEILDNGVAKACAELNIPIVAYSPLGRGFLVSHCLPSQSEPQTDRLSDRANQVTQRHSRRRLQEIPTSFPAGRV